MQIGWRSVMATRSVCGGELITEKLSISEKGRKALAIDSVLTIGSGVPI
jgi:hypothetical protein